jgi:hypothetical protein
MAKGTTKTPNEPEIVLTGIWGFLSKRLGIDPWGQVLIVALVFLIVPVIEGFRLVNSKINTLQVSDRISEKIEPLNAKVDGLTERMSTVEGEIKVLLAQRSLALAGKYAKEGKIELAVRAAQQGANNLALAVARRPPVPPEYFADTVEIIDGVAHATPSAELSRRLQDARLSLAEYRSALMIGRVTYTQKFTWKKMEHAFSLGFPNTGIVGGYFDATQVTGDFITVESPAHRKLSENLRIKGTAILNGVQTLDGIRWRDAVFIGTHIRYLGGELDLDHVTFVGCTFEAPDTHRGAKFAEYAALQLPSIKVG